MTKLLHLKCELQVSKNISNEFDPFRVVVSFASEADNADWFFETFSGIGLRFDLGDDNSSHRNRIRALSPRVLEAYESLSQEAKLAAANSATGSFLSRIQQLEQNPNYLKKFPQFQGFSDRMLRNFQKIGWGFQDDQLVTLNPQIREMFFPKGSQWDAFVVIRGIIEKAKSELMVVDPFCDREIFAILQSSTARPKMVRLLCRNKPDELKAEAKKFCEQHSEMCIEVRTSSDFHDRFLVVDQATCIHIGASINHAGSRAFMISAVEDKSNRDALIKVVNEAWTTGVSV